MKVTYFEALLPSTESINGKDFFQIYTNKTIVDVWFDLHNNESEFIMIKKLDGKNVIIKKDDIIMIDEREVVEKEKL